jgi:hypothetical protein
MNTELLLSIAAALLSAASLAVSILKRRKPTLAGAVARAVLYGKGLGGTRDEQIMHACHAVIREDMGDNGKRDWPDHRIRQEVQAHFR